MGVAGVVHLERTADSGHAAPAHLGIDLCGLEARVSEQFLDVAQVGALIQEGVAKLWRSVCALAPLRPARLQAPR